MKSTFKVSARTVLHLGSELISSDAVAFYELIKNAFDARSPNVDVDVDVAMSFAAQRALYQKLAEAGLSWPPGTDADKASGGSQGQRELSDLRAAFVNALHGPSPRIEELRQRVAKAKSLEDFAHILDETGVITISDTGDGMTLTDLRDVYLTIGTPSRLEDREEWREAHDKGKASGDRPVLGEKGVGRLAAMRLGEVLSVQTSEAGETNWNILHIDWSVFTHDRSALLDEIEVEPRRGSAKDKTSRQGTTIRISRLTAPWTREKLEEIVRNDFARLSDPFGRKSKFPMTIRFNGAVVEIPRFNKTLFEHAHASIKGHYTVDPLPRFAGAIEFRPKEDPETPRQRTVALEGSHLISTIGGMEAGSDINELQHALQSLGAFSYEVYWFNRQRLTGIDGFGDQAFVRNLVNVWGGGVMLFRDGFRVHPYGGPDDDWLGLDRKALASGGYKVNRAQLIGKVDISALTNPNLIDQTNREGLKESPERRALQKLMLWILEQLRNFMNEVEKEIKAKDRVALEDLEERVTAESAKTEQAVAKLVTAFPRAESEFHIRSLISENRRVIDELVEEFKARVAEYESGRTQLLNLAGIGLLVEILAHELNRSATHALETLTEASRRQVPPDIARVFTALQAQMKTLQKRLRTLDPLSTRGRQVKEDFDLVQWTKDILEQHDAQFRRHGIRLRYATVPEHRAQLRVRLVKGMIVQVLENLISNSVYWLKQERKLQPEFRGEISVTVDAAKREIRFSDNGPGIELSRQDLVFSAFHSTKPPGQGSGLGLYIAREIAYYHGANLYLSPERSGKQKTLHTFVFSLDASKPRARITVDG